jgi:YD repeat-containing protein
MANNTAHLVFVGYSGTASTDVFRVELQKVAAGYQLRVQVRDNASTWQSSAWVTISDDKHAVELSWTAGSAGKVEWWIDGGAQPATATVNNSTRRIDLVRLGAVAAVDATTTGTLYLDAFESRRTTPIGVLGATLTTTTNFGYDPLYRLTTTLYSTGPAFTYTYDAVGNMLTRNACLTAGCTPTTTNYVYDAANRLSSVDSVAYTWDANGNLLSDGARTYTYDAVNRLTALVTGGITTTYTYNGQNDRVAQQIGAGALTRYTLDLAALHTQVLADGTNRYLYGLGRIGEQQPGGMAYHLADHLGSVRQLVNASGAVTLARSYDPFGLSFSPPIMHRAVCAHRAQARGQIAWWV